jgi:hypothetical protein
MRLGDKGSSVLTVADSVDRSALKIWITLRLAIDISASANQYVPAGRTRPGIWTGWLKVS